MISTGSEGQLRYTGVGILSVWKIVGTTKCYCDAFRPMPSAATGPKPRDGAHKLTQKKDSSIPDTPADILHYVPKLVLSVKVQQTPSAHQNAGQ